MSLTELPEINSEQLAKYHDKVDSLKIFLEKTPNFRQFITYHALEVAIASHGGKAALIKTIIGDAKEWKEFCARELTPEEIAEFEQMEKDEHERMMRDFTPPKENPLYADTQELAKWLYAKAEESDEAFDETFEHIMVHRYNRRIVKIKGDELEVWQKCEFEESEHIITGL